MFTIAALAPCERWEQAASKVLREEDEFLCGTPVSHKVLDSVDFSLCLADLYTGHIDYLLFTCPTAIESAMELVSKRAMKGLFDDLLKKAHIMVIGKMTADCANVMGVKVDSMASEPTTAGMLAHLSTMDVIGKNIVLMRSDQATDSLPNGLRAMGMTVTDIPVYQIMVEELEVEHIIQKVIKGTVDALLFPTSVHVHAFLVLLEERVGWERTLDILEDMVLATMGEEGRNAFEEHGIYVDVLPTKATPEDLLRATIEKLTSS